MAYVVHRCSLSGLTPVSPVDEPFDGEEDPVPGSLLVLEHLGHVVPQQRGRDDQQDEEDDDLEDVLGHQSFSGAMSA